MMPAGATTAPAEGRVRTRLVIVVGIRRYGRGFVMASPFLWRSALSARCVGEGRLMHRAGTAFLLPEGRIRVYSSWGRAGRHVLAVVHFVHVAVRLPLALPVLESLEDLLGRDLAVIVEEEGVVEKVY
jgi:hypothetical protein